MIFLVLIELQKMLNEARRNIGNTIIGCNANRESLRGFEKTIAAIEDKCLFSVFDLACAAYLDGKILQDTFYFLFGRVIIKKADKIATNSLTGKLIDHIKWLKDRYEADGDLPEDKRIDKTTITFGDGEDEPKVTVKTRNPFGWLADNLKELEKARKGEVDD